MEVDKGGGNGNKVQLGRHNVVNHRKQKRGFYSEFESTNGK
ncbi:hypothetical protein SAMN03080606_03818 [Alkaliphilus peptidifermentans DSM 18978]|uniref:Uncharacterized protein n=1 Tax=Alkaliphilus peptidifermentans DSM 18978 TaxID=1120976 RepID=A0A1G5KVU9_9FIRM|nr:hypothetical protein SAMN03080606_03818 [Alkaliphilus peptidifermentans DSM 18978]